jgi:hypothetical protein
VVTIEGNGQACEGKEANRLFCPLELGGAVLPNRDVSSLRSRGIDAGDRAVQQRVAIAPITF